MVSGNHLLGQTLGHYECSHTGDVGERSAERLYVVSIENGLTRAVVVASPLSRVLSTSALLLAVVERSKKNFVYLRQKKFGKTRILPGPKCEPSEFFCLSPSSTFTSCRIHNEPGRFAFDSSSEDQRQVLPLSILIAMLHSLLEPLANS